MALKRHSIIHKKYLITGRFTPQASARFRTQASAYLTRTFGTPTSQQNWTYSVWLKVGDVSRTGNYGLFGVYGSGSPRCELFIDTQQIWFLEQSGATAYGARSNNVLRDPSAWYHIVLSANTTNGQPESRFRIFLNGLEVSYNAGPTMAGNGTTYINTSAVQHQIGYWSGSTFDGHMSEINFVDGQTLYPTSFGQTDPETGAWVPKRYSGTYGNNGLYLVPTIGNLVYDQSGNGNNWSATNMTLSGNNADFGIVDVPGVGLKNLLKKALVAALLQHPHLCSLLPSSS
jgi:hypothetical protein